MPETITVIAEKMGSLMLEGGIEVKIIQVEDIGVRLIVDRPLAYCGNAISFVGDENNDGEQAGSDPITRMSMIGSGKSRVALLRAMMPPSAIIGKKV
jgi:hypothetical protein